jgi:hypothetical protein
MVHRSESELPFIRIVAIATYVMPKVFIALRGNIRRISSLRNWAAQ